MDGTTLVLALGVYELYMPRVVGVHDVASALGLLLFLAMELFVLCLDLALEVFDFLL